MARFEDAINAVLIDEGGLEDDSSDEGGITNWGISLRFYKEIKPDAMEDDIRTMTRDMAIEIYRKCFWDKQKYNLIANQNLATKVFDIAINISPMHANKCLQRAVNAINSYHEFSAQYIDIDGILGARSLYSINNSPPIALLNEFKDTIKSYYMALVSSNPKDSKFLKGWIRRASE